jgi:hypothetical protein
MSSVHKDVVDKLKKPTGDELIDGDILFRWVPKGIDQRKPLQGLITGAQVQQMATQYQKSRQMTAQGKDGLDDTAVKLSALVIQHVGIYVGGSVREIGAGWFGKGGLKTVPIEGRSNIDLVVRSRTYGKRIAHFARIAQADLRQSWIYPMWDLGNIGYRPTRGFARRNTSALNKAELAVHRGRSSPAKMKQAVVCSHFVHAVLYAAVVPGGTLRTATDHRWDDVFKISPSHMWTEFLHGRGLWATLNAYFVGVQRRGILSRNVDPRILGVGLRMPPIPSRAGRRPITALT